MFVAAGYCEAGGVVRGLRGGDAVEADAPIVGCRMVAEDMERTRIHAWPGDGGHARLGIVNHFRNRIEAEAVIRTETVVDVAVAPGVMRAATVAAEIIRVAAIAGGIGIGSRDNEGFARREAVDERTRTEAEIIVAVKTHQRIEVDPAVNPLRTCAPFISLGNCCSRASFTKGQNNPAR